MTRDWRPRKRVPAELSSKQDWLERVSRLSGATGLVLVAFAGLVFLIALAIHQNPSANTFALNIPGGQLNSPRSPNLLPTRTTEPIADVAIVAGHWSKADPSNNSATIPDPGSVCADGTKEVDINYGVASRTLSLMGSKGFRVTLLEEWDSRLKDPNRDSPDFTARVFLSIHSDACVTGPDYPLATGYKIAHAQPSENASQDDRLVRCLVRDYDTVVAPYKLRFNENTITPDMTMYHAFRQIVPTTPAAIIELGFLGRDRVLLSQHQDELAAGLANGLTSFLRGDQCDPGNPGLN